jgi:stress-induced morphogen
MSESLRLRTVLGAAFLRLTPDEVDYFVHRVRTSSKAGSKPAPDRIAWRRVAIEAAAATWATQKTCAAFSRRIAYMDHSDNGIRALFERSGAQWEEPKKLRLTRLERLIAAIVALRFVQVNRAEVQPALNAAGADLRLAAERLAAGAGCFGRFTAQAVVSPDSWRGLFLTADVSFLRMFACYAAVRADRPTSLYVGYRLAHEEILPIAADTLFTFDAAAAESFNTPPMQVIIDVHGARERSNPDDAHYEVGIVTDNFAGISEVWTAARVLARHPVVRSVLIRLHPGSEVTELPSDMPACVSLCDSQEPLPAFSERVDLALVSNSSAVAVLQDLLLPCFHARQFYSHDDLWGRRDLPLMPVGPHSLPEVVGALSEFFDELSPAVLDAERNRLRSVAGGPVDLAAARVRVRAALEGFL